MTESILVVDDNEQARQLVADMLEEAGYQIRQAPDGVSALALVKQEPPALVVLDLMMPSISGLEVCRRLKAEPTTSTIPILVVTAIRQFAPKEAALECGADDCITKPICEDDLLARVRALLKVQGVRQEKERILAYIRERDTETRAHRSIVLQGVLPACLEAGRPVTPGGRVLVIDGKSLTRNVNGKLLRDQGYDVLRAASLPEGLAILERHLVEAVMLAEQLEEPDGRDTVTRIRAVQPDLPIIILLNDARYC